MAADKIITNPTIPITIHGNKMERIIKTIMQDNV